MAANNSKTKNEKMVAGFNAGSTSAESTVTKENALKAIEDGLGEIFEGYMKVFLGLAKCSEDMRGKAASMVENMAVPQAADEAENVPASSMEKGLEQSVEQKTAPARGTAPAQVKEKDQENASLQDKGQTEVSEPIAENAPAITKDDILREIQAKFRKDKKNQEKIRSILLAYGASELSLLDKKKYADFLNSVREL